MSMFRLQTFSPAGTPDTADKKKADEAARLARDVIWQEGYEAGQSAAADLHRQDQSRLTGELIEALHDAGLTNEASRRHVMAGISPFVASVTSAIAPAIAEAGMAREINRLIGEAIDAAPGARPLIRCSVDLAPTVDRATQERGFEADVEASGDFSTHEAQIIWDQGFDHIDLEGCVARIREILGTHMNSESGSNDHD